MAGNDRKRRVVSIWILDHGMASLPRTVDFTICGTARRTGLNVALFHLALKRDVGRVAFWAVRAHHGLPTRCAVIRMPLAEQMALGPHVRRLACLVWTCDLDKDFGTG